MIGHDLKALTSISKSKTREVARADVPVLKVLGLGRRGAIEPVDLEVYDGEVVGLAGLLGSGRTELARLIYGADHADHGTEFVRGQAVKMKNPRVAVSNRIAFSSEDRRGEGVVGDLTVAENVTLGIQAKRGWLRKVNASETDELVTQYITSLQIKPDNPNALVRNLSGGNQQKVLLARWLATAPQLLILDEPTRGIDVGAKAEIQRLVADLAESGMGVIFISSELDEVLRLAQRMIVLRDHHKIGELENSAGTGVNDIVAMIAKEGAA